MKSIEMQHIAGLSPSSPLPTSSSSSSSSSSTSSAAASVSTITTSAAAVTPNVPGTRTAAASSQHFCLRWNNYQTNLTQVFDQLLQNESFVDVTLVCENHSIKAHKMVLSACSPYFQSLFYDNPCQHPIIIFTDVKWPEMKAIVDFMYRGEINVSHDQISPLLKVAEILKIRGLTDVNSNDKDLYFESAAGELAGDAKIAGGSGRRPAEISVDLTARTAKDVAVTESALASKGRKRFRHSDNPIVRSPKSSDRDTLATTVAVTDPIRLMDVAISALDCTTNGQLCDDFVPIVDDLVPANATARLDIKPDLDDIENQTALNNNDVPGTVTDDDDDNDDDDDDNGDNNDVMDDDDDNNDDTNSPNNNHHHQQQQQQQQHLDNLMTGTDATDTTKQHHKPVLATVTAFDDTEIKPGIAEMIREEERAKMLDSSHNWLGAAAAAAASSSSTTSSSSVADYLEDESSQNERQQPQPLRPTSSNGGGGGGGGSMPKTKVPSWTQNELNQAIEAVIKQKMRFTQASTRYKIPKGTLYDNILGKTNRMIILDEIGLTMAEELAVIQFCCNLSTSPYNRKTNLSLANILTFVRQLIGLRRPRYELDQLTGYRWWWAFCKRHNINSLYYENNKRCLFVNRQRNAGGGGGASSSGSGTGSDTGNNDIEKKPLTESYQYQLQSMWQKCWNTNQSLVHNLRFRERGPLKSWRPETMAEAIFSVLKEGLSLSQAARKYDIPYPTFVLYANRVHNMLGPSADGLTDLRPKGRGRPQRILLGIWPDDLIRGAIRTVVFRDSQNFKDDTHFAYSRLQDTFPATSCTNPDSLPATVVAAVAQNLRQQMCNMVVAAQHQQNTNTSTAAAATTTTNSDSNVANFVNSLAFAAAASCANTNAAAAAAAAATTTTSSSVNNENGNNTELSLVGGLGMRNLPESLTITPATSVRTQPLHAMHSQHYADDSSVGGESVQDLRMNSPLDSQSDSRSPTMDMVGSHMLEPALNLDVGLDMSSLACGNYRTAGNNQQLDNSRLFHRQQQQQQNTDDNNRLDDIVKSTATDTDVVSGGGGGISLKIEPLDCRSD